MIASFGDILPVYDAISLNLPAGMFMNLASMIEKDRMI